MDKQEIVQKLKEKFENNYHAYLQDLQGMNSHELIEKAKEIAATKLVYQKLNDGGYNVDYLEYLLRFRNPLEVVRDQWLKEQGDILAEDMEHVLWTLADKGDAEQDYELDAEFRAPEQGKGVQMC